MAILFHRAGEQAKPLDFFRPRVRLSIVLVEVESPPCNVLKILGIAIESKAMGIIWTASLEI